MHPSLARQLRRLCGLDTSAQLTQLLTELHDKAPTAELAAFANGLVALFERVNSTYEQYDRDLALRYRSLEESSAELNQINDQMREDIASRNRVLKSLREAADLLRTHNQQLFCVTDENDLEGHSALLVALIEQEEQHRRELINQRFAMDQHAIVSITDIEGTISYVNDKFVAVSGYSRDELIGVNHRMIKSETQDAAFFRSMWTAIAAGDVWHGEICNRARNGEHYWIDATIVPFLNEAGRPVQYISIGTNITHQKILAQKIASSEHQYRSLVENVREIIFQLDDMGHWVFLNPAWEEITGYSIAESLGKNCLDYSHPDDIDRAFTIFRQLVHGEISSHKSEQRYYDSRGNVRWFEVSIQSEFDPVARKKIYAGTLNDVTERRRIAQLQSEFISVVSHELRTPLTSIRGSLGLLESGHMGSLGAAQQRLIHIAHKNSQRLVTLVNDILDMEKLMAGKMSLKNELLNLCDLIELAIETNQAYAQTFEVSMTFREAPPGICVVADADRLMQVMSNLLSNAIKYSPKHKPVEVFVTIENEQARVCVQDHGPGIPPKFRPRIFSAFAQADSSDTRQQGGTGLGLNISKTLVEKMGGRIGFDSEPGVGTRFWFSLPLAGETRAAPASTTC